MHLNIGYCWLDVYCGVNFEPKLSLEHSIGQETETLCGSGRVKQHCLGVALGLEEPITHKLDGGQVPVKQSSCVSNKTVHLQKKTNTNSDLNYFK